MKKTAFSFFILMLILTACGKEKKSRVPDNIISRDTLPVILSDVYLAEAGLSSLSRQGDTVNKKIPLFYEAIFKKHNTSRARFDSSISWYSQHPKLLFEIYQDALDLLIRKQSETLRSRS